MNSDVSEIARRDDIVASLRADAARWRRFREGIGSHNGKVTEEFKAYEAHIDKLIAAEERGAEK